MKNAFATYLQVVSLRVEYRNAIGCVVVYLQVLISCFSIALVLSWPKDLAVCSLLSSFLEAPWSAPWIVMYGFLVNNFHKPKESSLGTFWNFRFESSQGDHKQTCDIDSICELWISASQIVCQIVGLSWASWKTFPKEKFPEEYQKRCEQAKAERELDGVLGWIPVLLFQLVSWTIAKAFLFVCSIGNTLIILTFAKFKTS